MALNWDCSPAKSCYDVGRARYTMDGLTASSKPRDDEAIPLAPPPPSPNKVRFARQQRPGGGRSHLAVEGGNPQDICSYPDSAIGPPFAPPRYVTAALHRIATTSKFDNIKAYRIKCCHTLCSFHNSPDVTQF